jgi:hypothetical protein
MAFADAAFDGVATLEGVEARRASDVVAIRECFAQRLVAVYVGPFDTVVSRLMWTMRAHLPAVLALPH